MTEYEIQERKGVCFDTGRQLEEGESYYAVLMGTEAGFNRRDYSAEAWREPPPGFFCFWRSRVPRRAEKQRTLVDDEVILHLFMRLEQSCEEVKRQFRFVLGLLLMRRRVLKYEETIRRDGSEYWIMRVASDGERVEIQDPKLEESQITRIGEELGAILRGDPRALDTVDALAEAVPSGPADHIKAEEGFEGISAS